MSWHFNEIEAKLQKYWAKKKTFKVDNNSEKPKYYVLDMFPYLSGAGENKGENSFDKNIKTACCL